MYANKGIGLGSAFRQVPDKVCYIEAGSLGEGGDEWSPP